MVQRKMEDVVDMGLGDLEFFLWAESHHIPALSYQIITMATGPGLV